MIENTVKTWLGDLSDEYLEIVNKSPKTTHTEKHHILPVSLFPEYENIQENIVSLDILDHLKAHEILAKTNDHKMLLAFWMMFTHSERRFSEFSDSVKTELLNKYELARIEMSKAKSDWGKTRTGSLNNFFGKTQSPYAKKRASETHKGKKLPKDHIEAIRLAHKGVPKRKLECPHCHKLVPCNLINRWHNDNCKLKGS